jgi:hypothetical protein
MMTAEELITHCREKDIQLEVISPESLKCRYQKGVLHEDLAAQLRDMKPGIIEILLSRDIYQFVYRIEVDGKKTTVVSNETELQLKISIRKKFGAERVGAIETTSLRLVR